MVSNSANIDLNTIFILIFLVVGWFGWQRSRSPKTKGGSENPHSPNPNSLPAVFSNSQDLGSSTSSAHTGDKVYTLIDVNQATVQDWLQLPSLSIEQAQTLVQLRQLGIPFYCLEDVAVALKIPPQQLVPFAPVLRFSYYEPLHDSQLQEAIVRINPNIANSHTLTAIPHLSPALAQEIIHQRIMGGPYRNLIDFQRRLQLPSFLVSRLMHYLNFD